MRQTTDLIHGFIVSSAGRFGYAAGGDIGIKSADGRVVSQKQTEHSTLTFQVRWPINKCTLDGCNAILKNGVNAGFTRQPEARAFALFE
jgi:hypothetical protein